MIYETLLLVGAIGIIAQAIFGLGHGHGGHHTGGHSAGQTNGHSPAGHGHHTHDAQNRTELHGEHGLSPLWTTLSPLTIFSMCLGIGATGLLLAPLHWVSVWRALTAIAGGVAFYALAVRPLWGLVFQFASTPGRALEGAVAGEAEALGRFDTQGRGMVRLHIDGQIVRVLATLEAGEQSETITSGDHLTVVSIDPHANTCRVARL